MKKKAAPVRKRRPAPTPAPKVVEKPIVLSSPVVFMSNEGPRAAVVHGLNEDGTLELSVFVGDQIVHVHHKISVGDGEVGTCRRADV